MQLGPHPTARKLLITGCGRSGTKYIALLMRRLGLDVRHEELGVDGVASWYMAVDTNEVPFGPALRGCEFEHIHHQLRHPLAVIASASTFKRQTWEFICAHIPVSLREPLPLRCAKYWYYWNLEAEKVAHWRYRVEDLSTVFQAMCRRLEVPGDPALLERVPMDLNTRSRGRLYHYWQEALHRLHLEYGSGTSRSTSSAWNEAGQNSLTWADLDALDPLLSARIRAKAIEYGYTP
jgi:hypothetical protein